MKRLLIGMAFSAIALFSLSSAHGAAMGYHCYSNQIPAGTVGANDNRVPLPQPYAAGWSCFVVIHTPSNGDPSYARAGKGAPVPSQTSEYYTLQGVIVW